MTSSTSPTSGRHFPSILKDTREREKETQGALLHNRFLIVTWRSMLIVACLVGIVLDSLSLGFLPQLVYFTLQSNFFLVGYLGYALWTTARKTAEPPSALAGAAILYILITGLVFNLVLAKGPILLSGSLSSILLHFCVPIMATLDWLLFLPHRRLHWRNALHWLIYPLAYLAFVLIRGLLISGPYRYPYFFVNVDQIGYGGVALNTLIFGIAFWLLGLLLIVLDRVLTHLINRGRTA
jgi:hypothetical protein